MNILYFSPIQWSALKQRPQHLAECLSEYYQICYVEPSISILSSILQRNSLFHPIDYQLHKNLRILRFSGKYRLPKSIEVLDLQNFNSLYERKKIQKIVENFDIVWLGNPIFYSLLEKCSKKTLIYDKMDDYVYLTRNIFLKRLISTNEEKLIKEARIIFVSSSKFLSSIKRDNVYLLNNGVEKNFIDSDRVTLKHPIVDKVNRLKKGKCTVFGYVGTIDHWFDFQIIKKVLKANSSFHVVLVGKNNCYSVEEERIHYFSPVTKEFIPAIINSFDFCLYPFKLSSFLDTIDPVKIYEYLSLNKRILAVRSQETQKFNDHLNLYGSYYEFEKILDRINRGVTIETPFPTQQEVSAFIAQNSWEERALQIRRVLEQL